MEEHELRKMELNQTIDAMGKLDKAEEVELGRNVDKVLKSLAEANQRLDMLQELINESLNPILKTIPAPPESKNVHEAITAESPFMNELLHATASINGKIDCLRILFKDRIDL